VTVFCVFRAVKKGGHFQCFSGFLEGSTKTPDFEGI
jgi:hypothetical protein